MELVIEGVVLLSNFIDFLAEDFDTFAVVRLSASGSEFTYPEECVLAAPALPDLPHEAVVPSTVAKLAAVIDEE